MRRIFSQILMLAVVGCQGIVAQDVGVSAWGRLLAGSERVNGEGELTLLLATPIGKQAQLERDVKVSRGIVVRAIPEIGYLRVTVPTDKVATLVNQRSVVAFAIDGKAKLSSSVNSAPIPADPVEEARWKQFRSDQAMLINDAMQKTKQVDAARTEFPASLLQPNSAFDPNAPMQATDWLKQHPSFDGRGVTIAVVEGVADLSNPSLRDAKDLKGATIPKIAAIVDPEFVGNEIPDWAGEVHFSMSPKMKDGTLCPKPASVAEVVGVWQGYVGHLRGGHPEFCVAWEKETKTARIDLNRDGNFADETALHPYNETPGYVKVSLGTQYAAAYLQYDATRDKLFLHTTPDNHPTMVATAAAATDIMGTGVGGVAPGARLIFAHEGEGWSGLIETFWRVASRSDVDLVTASTGISSYPNDAAPLYNLFLDRISDVTGKPILMAARNHGPALEQSDAGHRTMTVGGYDSAEAVAAFGLGEQRLSGVGRVVDYSSNGPSMSGDIGTDFVTPVLGITGWNWGNIEDRPLDIYVGEKYKVPLGFGIGGGTSVATPRAAGVVALLLSAAKQAGLRVNAAMIKQAIMASAKPVEGDGIYRQGAGLVQVSAAWDALQELAREPKATIHSSSTAISPLYPYWWRGPKRGDSIYLVRDVIVGETRKLPLDLWMDSPSKEGSQFELSLVGDKGNFDVPASVDLSQKRSITVAFHSLEPGSYSALLRLTRPGMKYPVAEIPIFVASTPAPEELSKGVEITRTVTAEDQQFVLFNLPKGSHHIEATLESTSGIQPVVRYVVDDGQLRHFASDTLVGSTQVGYSDIPAIGDASILGVNIDVRSNYPLPCCSGTYTLKLKVTSDQLIEKSDTEQRADLEVPAVNDWLKETDVTVKGGAGNLRLTALCRKCSKDGYEVQVYKPYKDRRGDHIGLWTYWPVFHGTWSDVVPREKEDTNWKFIVMRRPPVLVNEFTPEEVTK